MIRRSPFLLAALATVAGTVSFWALAAKALTQGPLVLIQASGQIQVRNTESRFQRVRMAVYQPRLVDGRKTAAEEPLAVEEAERIVSFRPSSFRLGAGEARSIRYRVLDVSREFYVCSVSASGLTSLRVCSRWPGRAVKPASPGPKQGQP